MTFNPDYHGPACGCDRCLGREGEVRIDKLRRGDWGFGHQELHQGIGTRECPRKLHHHHDEFCDLPTQQELKEAGIKPEDFKAVSRADHRE